MNLIRFVGDNMEDEPIKELKTLKEWMKRKIKYAIKSKEYANPRLSPYYLSDTRPKCSKCGSSLTYIKEYKTSIGKMYYCEKCKGKVIIT